MKNKHQIHIAGAKRSGKTTLAVNLARNFSEEGFMPEILDVDRVRVQLFGGIHGVPDSEESKKEHRDTMLHLYAVLLPQSIDAGRIPIVVSGHTHLEWLEKAKSISKEKNTALTFFVLRAPTIEEASHRAKYAPPEHQTDMQDFDDPVIRNSFLRSVSDIKTSYDALIDPHIAWVDQDTPESMAGTALKIILSKE